MAAAQRRVNWFAIWISVAVVVVVAGVAALVIWMNSAASDPGPTPQSAIVDAETGAIVFGEGPDTVETYLDFMCPYCAQFEQAEGETIQGLVASNDITLRVTPVAILDRLSQGTEFSSRAASAMYAIAVADPDNVYAFMQAMFASQPAENTPGLTDEQIVEVARAAGVNVTPELEQSILDHEYLRFAQTRTLPDGAGGTPAVLVNGELIQVTYNPQTDIVSRLS